METKVVAVGTSKKDNGSMALDVFEVTLPDRTIKYIAVPYSKIDSSAIGTAVLLN